MGTGGAVVDAGVGVLSLIAAFYPNECLNWREAFFIDAVLSFAIAGAVYSKKEKRADVLAAVALILFAVTFLGFFYGILAC